MTGKRAFDLLGATLGGAVLSPVIAVIALVVRWKLGRPVLFRQTRPGLHGQPFELVKFRTMTTDRGPDGQLLPDEQRLPPVGRFLRSTSLDELPELWNVARGDMSLVGPRPLLLEYLPRYSARQARRHEVRPGLSGWAQVNGRNAPDWDTRLEMDVWYVENHSLALDLRILARTVRAVLRREGISQPGHVTAEPFRGSAASEGGAG